MLRDFFLGFVRIHILHHAALEPIYGVAIMEELRRHGYDLSPGTLYPLLHNLEAAGYLQHQDTTWGARYANITASHRPANRRSLRRRSIFANWWTKC